jgi:antibiotic biosynthesis monooxygenase (ABM) superfamily enzyme
MPIHVAIIRRVLPGREAEFQSKLQEFFGASFSRRGVLGATMIVPPPGSTSPEFGILRTFSDEKERDDFYSSRLFAEWRKAVTPLTEGEPEHRELHGLEAWFRSRGGEPPKWKMAVATVIGVYPTSIFLSVLLGKALKGLPVWLGALVMGTSMVALLTWVVMPIVTRILHNWLHKKTPEKGISK